MRITSKGQVTIPQHIREDLGLLPETEVEMVAHGQTVVLRKAKGGDAGARGRRLIAHMRGRGKVRMITDQIMALTRGR